MTKIFTLVILLFVVLSVNAQKKVAYVTKQKDMATAAGAAGVDNDAIIQLLKADAKFNVTVFLTDGDGNDVSTTTMVDLNGFDVIIAQETYGSGDNVWKTGYPLFIGTLPAPTLYNKVYALRKGKALSDGAGASADATEVVNMKVADGASGHYIFTGITPANGVITVVKGGVTDDGDAGTKTIQYNTGNVISAANTLLAYPEGVEAVIGINDLPEGCDIDGTKLSKRVIVFDFNFGQLVKDGGQNLTDEGMLLWKNAIYSLAGLEKEEPNAISDIKVQNFDLINYGKQITVNFNQAQKADIAIYSIEGKMIAKQHVNGKSANFNMNAQAKGVYIIKVEGNSVNESRKFIVE